jgi:hypothetical protein
VVLALVAIRLLAMGAVLVAILELLLLLAYAGIGGALYLRRFELGFVPRISPERSAERGQRERAAARQQIIDGMYRDLRVRETPRAISAGTAWLQQAAAAD